MDMLSISADSNLSPAFVKTMDSGMEHIKFAKVG